MWRHIFTESPWRRGAAGVTLGLALLLAACGPAGVTTKPTPTVAPTATPAPPCTTWRVIPSPATKYTQSALTGVVGLSSTEAWAVGATYIGEGNTTTASLVERWNGSAWSIVASPGGPSLNGVAAVSANDIWAVGGASGRFPGIPFSPTSATIIHWNGTQWSVVPGVTAAGALNSVVALASDNVWAVGFTTSTSGTQPLAERWNGSAWQAVASPTPTGATVTYLYAVAAVPGTNQLWAVGSTLKTPRVDFTQALIERWDGSSWQIVTNPTLPTGSFASTLTSVVALSATDAWAVGNYTASDHQQHTLIIHWDGAAWKFVSAPDVWGMLSDVAAVGPHDVRAVGLRFVEAGNSNDVGIAERWDGATWSVADTSTPAGVTDTFPQAIATDGAGGYWATGYSFTPNFHSLILRCT